MTAVTEARRSRAASGSPASCRSRACRKSPSKTAYAVGGVRSSGPPASSAYREGTRQIIRSRLKSISATSAPKDSSNIDWPRVDAAEVRAFVKERIGSVKAPKQVEVWADRPRSKIGKVLKPDIRA